MTPDTIRDPLVRQLLDDAQRMSELSGENWIQRVGVWVDCVQKLAAYVEHLHDCPGAAHEQPIPRELFAWVGEDEHGSGDVGLKQAFVPAGLIPLVSTHAHKLTSTSITTQLQAQATRYGKTIRLVRFTARDVAETIEP